ncbi:hypothetical protein V8E36_005604 [Tilletia maclaganii]
MSSELSRRVLISGAGIAGPVAAYWLGRAGIKSTVVDRVPAIQPNGQTIDIRGSARSIIKAMGVEENIRARTTQEEGMYIVDEQDRVWGSFGVDEENGNSAVCDIEILRAQLVKIFVDASKPAATYRWADPIKNIEHTEREAIVEFKSGLKEPYDVVILADGMNSRPRELIFPKSDEEYGVTYDSLGFKTAYFSIPYVEAEDGTWSRWWINQGSRTMWLRPDGKSNPPSTRAFLISCSPEANRLFKDYRTMDIAEQKRVWRQLYQRSGWKSDRILDEMDKKTGTEDEDFHMQDIAQIKSKKWHRGRVVLVGDAAYCPSPMSGMGTSAAIVGAYALAKELSAVPDWSSPSSVTQAFQAYDNKIRKFIEDAQDIPRSLIRLANPSSWVGMKFAHYAAAVGSFVTQSRLANRVFGFFQPEPWAEEKSLGLDKYSEIAEQVPGSK